MRILLVDNYDSFTYNLVHYFEGFDCLVDVVRNDEISFEQVMEYDKIVLSPGPGLPAEANQLNELIEQFIDKKPILGVCLGFQAIVEYYGGKLFNQAEVKHGVAEACQFKTDSRLFKELPTEFKIGLYHSWAADPDQIPEELIITATSENNVVMAFEHSNLPVCGVQFHPESILTENGKQIVQNFITNFN